MVLQTRHDRRGGAQGQRLPFLPVTETARVRTFHARQGRISPLTASRLEELMPQRSLPEGPLDAAVLFGRHAPLVLEVGCGHGAAAIAYAQTHPGHDVVAADVHTPGLARMLAAAERAGVGNLRVHHGDAVALLEARVPSGSLSAVHVFFPDPWPKARHAKRRLISSQTLDLLADRLRADGRLLLATDHEGYAGHALAQLRRHPLWVADVVPRPTWRPLDGFEAKGLAAGRRVVDVRAMTRAGGA